MVLAATVGPQVPWISGQDIIDSAVAIQRTLKDKDALDIPSGTATDIANSVSSILYRFSGSQFTGVAGPVTVRPMARPSDIDTRAWATMAPGGYMGSWGYCSAYGTPSGGANTASHYGCVRPPRVELGVYPIVSIGSVVIDGVTIPSNEYRVDDARWLIRVRPTAATRPTERWGWPTCQTMDLPPTEPGTFAVEGIRYGMPPPADGVRAAKTLGAHIALASQGHPNQLPTRVQSINRQGVSMAVLDIMDYVAKGRTGIYEVDLFLRAVNPAGATAPGLVWSPDIDQPQRTI